jgi:hypothetical protein
MFSVCVPSPHGLRVRGKEYISEKGSDHLHIKSEAHGTTL